MKWIVIRSEKDLPKKSGCYVVDMGEEVKMEDFEVNDGWYNREWTGRYSRWLDESEPDITIAQLVATWEAAENHWKEMLDEDALSPCKYPDQQTYFKQQFNIDL